MKRLAHRRTIAALAVLAAACGGSSDDAPDDASGGTTASGTGGGTIASSGTTAPEGEIPALEIVEWNQDASALRVSLVLRNQDTLPLPVTPESFSVTSTDGFSLGWVPFRWITNLCPAVNLPSSGSLRCEMGFSKSAEQEPARLVFAALDGRQMETPFPDEAPITSDNLCSHVEFDGYCGECLERTELIGSSCSSDEDIEHFYTLIGSGGDYCPIGAPALSAACFDALLEWMRGECAEDCGFHP
ncbi:hypothetical protein [Sorangium sp. So ce542]|uniref:hypothetical protein n=1 Tax=Sorangium sp. So ce542 TaxID=3133316 RepID=UPI003F5EBF96